MESRSKLEDSELELTPEDLSSRYPVKALWRLANGEKVNGIWLYANAHRLTSDDAGILLRCHGNNRHLQVVIASLSRLFRITYMSRRSAKVGKSITFWSTADKAEKHWKGCAMRWLECIAARGFSLEQMFDAIEDMAPKNLVYPPPAMIAGTWGGRIKDWVRKADREQDETRLWMDDEERIWVEIDDPDGNYIIEMFGYEKSEMDRMRKERDERRANGIILKSELKLLKQMGKVG